MSHCLRWLGACLLAKRFCYEVDMASKLVAADERRSKRATESCQSAFKFGSDAISMMFTAARVAPINLARRRSIFALPICGLTSLSLVIWPSVWPFDHGWTSAA